MKTYTYQVNGLQVNCSYEEDTIEEVFLPLLKQWTKMQQKKAGRLIVFLAAPPAVGKTTLATFLEFLSKEQEDIEEIQAVGLDGFHYPQDYILSHQVVIDGELTAMKDVKGCPETYDIKKLMTKLSQVQESDVKWPIYDRRIHDVIDDVVTCSKNIIVVEGNWLLLDEKGWSTLKQYCDYSIMIHADEGILKERLINRKIQGGLIRQDALAFYNKSDSANVRRVLANHLTPDLMLWMEENGNYRIKEK